MTFLKDQGLIQPEPPSVYSTHYGTKAAHFWSVTFQLVMIVEGRSLRYEARWPAPKNNEPIVYNQDVHAKGQICIAAAFKPGTA